MQILKNIAEICSLITVILALAVLLIRPLREWLFGLRHIKDGMKGLLQGDMLRLYYKHCEDGEIRQYEYKNFLVAYKAYKALGGNSFIEKIYGEVKKYDD